MFKKFNYQACVFIFYKDLGTVKEKIFYLCESVKVQSFP